MLTRSLRVESFGSIDLLSRAGIAMVSWAVILRVERVLQSCHGKYSQRHAWL